MISFDTIPSTVHRWVRHIVCAVLMLGILIQSSELENGTPVVHTPQPDKYGIDSTRYTQEIRTVQRGETLASILHTYDIASQFVSQATEKIQPYFNPRHLQAGDALHIYRNTHQEAMQMMVYRPKPEQFVVFDLRDSVSVYDGTLPKTVTRRTIQATITSSLYHTLEAHRTSTLLASELEKVFAWQVDFYHIQPNAQFAVLYDEHKIEDTTVDFEIVAARFYDAGQSYYAFHFEQDDLAGYYDYEGNTLKRPFLRSPVEFARITSGFGSRFHPILKRRKPHFGTDYAAPAGTPIRATADGTVEVASYTKGNGYYVKLKHIQNYKTAYLHMSRFAEGIGRGTRVQQGDVIGYVGSTGLATGPHVCYRFWKNNKPVDPLKLDLPPSDPLPDEYLPAFETMRDTLLPVLLTSTPDHLAL